MFDNKFICTLIAVMAAVFAICNFNSPRVTSVEGYLGGLPSMKTKVSKVAVNKLSGIPMYSVQNFQGMLPPRMMGMAQIGANIRYNCPSMDKMAFNPADPLSMANMVSENYVQPQQQTQENYGCAGGGCAIGCGKGGEDIPHSAGMMLNAGYADGDFNQQVQKAKMEAGSEVNTTGLLPIGDMTTVNALGEEQQVVMYDNLMYSNRRSRLRGAGDPIRGDLAITPCETGWFRPAVDPALDLQEGAMNVLMGDGRSQAALNALIYEDSGRTNTTIAGSQNVLMGNQYGTELLAGSSEVQVTAFP